MAASLLFKQMNEFVADLNDESRTETSPLADAESGAEDRPDK